MLYRKESLRNILKYVASDTYRSIVILSETLPNMVDLDRKVEIVNYVKESRSLFFRVLAIVKWSETSDMYIDTEEMLAKIRKLLESITDVANHLFQVSKIQLPTCSIPMACVLPAADVLSSGTYNRLPSCFFDFPVDREKINFTNVRSRISSQLLRILATHDFSKYQFIRYKVDHLVLGTPHLDVRLTTLNGFKGPWKIFDIKLKIIDSLEEGKCLATKFQLHYLVSFIEHRINRTETESPLDHLYNILARFCDKIVFEIFHIQLWKFQKLSKFQLEVHKEKLILKYWKSERRDDPLLLVVKLTPDGVVLEHDPPLDYKFCAREIQKFNAFTIIKDIIIARIFACLSNVYKSIIQLDENFASCLTFDGNSIIYRPSSMLPEFYDIIFTINEATGHLKMKGCFVQQFQDSNGPMLDLDSSFDEWISFLKLYRRFAAVNAIRVFTDGHQMQAMKVNRTDRDFGSQDVQSMRSLCDRFGDIYLAYISVNPFVSLSVMAAEISENGLVDYHQFIINPVGQKILRDCVADIQIKNIIANSELFEVHDVKDLPVFKTLTFKDDLSYVVGKMVEKVQLITLLSNLRNIGYVKSLKFLVTQPTFRELSLLEFFMGYVEPGLVKHFITFFMVDVVLRYDAFRRLWYVRLTFSDKLMMSFKRLKTVGSELIYISEFQMFPFDKIIAGWKNFLYLFENIVKIVTNTNIYNILNKIELSYHSLKIFYSNKYWVDIKIKNNQPRFMFYSNSGLIHLDSSIAQSFINRHSNVRNVPKTLFMMVRMTKSLLLLNSLKQSVCLAQDNVVSKTLSYLLCNQISLTTFTITYRNCYSINMTLIDGDHVQVFDNSYSSLWKDKFSNKASLIPITFLGGFLAHESATIGTICKKYPPATYTIHRGVINNIFENTYSRVPSRNLPGYQTCKLLLFFESSYFLRTIAVIFKLSQFSCIEQSCISIQIDSFVVIIGYDVKPDIPLFVFVNIHEKDGTESMVTTVLKQYLYQKILSIEFLPVNILQFFSLFKLPRDFLDDFCQVLRMELNPRPDIKWNIEWRHLPNVKQPFRILPISSYLMFQSGIYLVMIDFVSKADPSIYLTGIFIWSQGEKKIEDVHLFECSKLVSRSEDVKTILIHTRDNLKELIFKRGVENIKIHQVVQICLKCIIQNEFLLNL
ncbi:Mediator of RNA polymerase II transcription subunit 14 [Thelohanellus kitauei]|uniref:Mediator of RNA polymerase II transcription subunit 14 n=1 Tax=Thelohanellus kitauei TaxID=669202 RepID=A0A0C2N6G2_THEKT|nr:Mediator of RNA polymerase II transcription subunit 14 [Thelohanellus kitauei]